ncbi:nucleoside kinase [Cloacibacillus sp.]|uniref:nucleoside kinase n=1 Tax=Cloacibacillus sp. TaxID=2049023 RepID=UPI0025BE6318|nr:nucleoside kinase [Cloacibacillus sp.]MCC8058826.1 nucleoside kinase [Cloacibacillus sp.]
MSIEIKFKDRDPLIFEKPVTAREALEKIDFPKRKNVVACRVNRVQRPLSWEIVMDSFVEFITTDSIEGIEVYICTLSFLLTSAATRLKGIRLHLTQSMSYSYYYESPDGEITEDLCRELESEMRRMVAECEPIMREIFPIDVARAMMHAQKYEDKEHLLQFTGSDPVILYNCCGVYDFFGGALADCAAITPTFELRCYGGGIFLSGPTFADPTKTMAFVESPRLFRLIDSHTDWLKNLDISTMAGIHQQVTEGRARDMIMVCEALHTKLLSNTAARIEARPEVRLLCLAGPSSSGKTTSSRRLRVQLLSSGIKSATLELDNYFVDRERTPLDRDGKPDFEALEALDLELINEQIAALLAGEEVDIPKFDFIAGKRTKGYKMRLSPDELLVIEGIHGLNERLTESIPADKKYKIFICPLTGTNIDFHNRIGTTDTRLLRRLVRDARTRGHSAEATLAQWPSVVRGSHRHIFPYQEYADTLFNTSLAYEVPVLKGYVTPLLKTVKEESPVYGEATRLLSLLEYVPVIPSDDVPNLSVLREFIGGSCFE